MKSRQVIWLLLIYCICNLQTFASSSSNNPTSVSKKVYILLRTEQHADNLQKFKTLVESNLQYNNVNAQINTYRVTEPLPQMKIFKTAYQENFDYILLIDQIANYNVGLSNRKVNVGGKYTIRSYNLKSSDPTWKNHGNANCNITVIESVHNFTKQIINTISTSGSTDLIAHSNNASENQIKEIVIPEYKLKEVKLLETQIKLQKAKTKRVLSEIELLILETEKLLEIEIEKSKSLAIRIQEFR